MTDALATAIVASLPGTLIALATLISSLHNNGKLSVVEKSVNGLNEKRNEATQKSAHAEGVQAEKTRAEDAAAHDLPTQTK